MRSRGIFVVCWANDGNHIVVGMVDELDVTDDGQLWHDHSGLGGDIVCTGPFGLSYAPMRPVIDRHDPGRIPTELQTAEPEPRWSAK